MDRALSPSTGIPDSRRDPGEEDARSETRSERSHEALQAVQE